MAHGHADPIRHGLRLEHKLTSQMLGWTVLQHGAEALDSGCSPSSAEDNMGLCHGGTEGDGTLKVNSLNVTSSLKHSTIPHPPMG